MVFHKRTKDSRQRGSHTHGSGSMKKRRGAGNRGGRGNSGSGKRGDQKKPSFWKARRSLGKSGFTSKSRLPKINAIDIRTLEDSLPTLVKKGLVDDKGGLYVIDLAKLGYNKLLSAGKVTKKFDITVGFASAKAIEKIESAGGKVTVELGDVFESVSGASSEALEQDGTAE